MFSDDERVREWIGHIIENADKALSYVARLRYETWLADSLRVDAVERCLMRITEAAIRIGDERMSQIAPDLVFHQVRGLGNMLRHQYDALDMEQLWRTVTEALPPLREACAWALGK